MVLLYRQPNQSGTLTCSSIGPGPTRSYDLCSVYVSI